MKFRVTYYIVMAMKTEGAKHAFIQRTHVKGEYPLFTVVCGHPGCVGRPIKTSPYKADARTWRDRHNRDHASKP